ncbi:MAG: DUF2269 domain-containing protein [Methylobacillus sp.]|jgi:uncharacterized membrane protein|nr:DUF2269 domain-containing protein [Methylobacillus sp.]
MEYLLLKWLHILSAILMFGTGFGTAFYKWTTDRSGDTRSIALVMERVVLADWIFTTPTAFIQPITGLWMVSLAGWPLTQGWVAWAVALYILVGACWLPVVWQQVEMLKLARQAVADHQPLPERYWRLRRYWMTLGCIAFTAMIAISGLMVLKP